MLYSAMVMPQESPRQGTLFEGLPLEELQRVGERLSRVTFAAESVVIAQGALLSGLYILESGVLSVDYQSLQDGEERRLTRLLPGECAGEMSVLTGLPASATITAIVDSSTSILRRDDLMHLLATCPRLALNVATILSRRLYHTDQDDHGKFAHRMRLRVHADTPPFFVERIVREVSKCLHVPLLVVDERIESLWQPDELLPSLETVLGSDGIWHTLHAHLPAAVRVFPQREVSAEVWTRFQAWLPPSVTHVLLITSVDATASRLPGVIEREFTRDLSLWPQGEEVLPEETRDVALICKVDPPASRQELHAKAAQQGGTVVRLVSEADVHVEWLARHLACKKVGLVLGAGGARGFAHLGVLRALERADVPVDVIAGCSIGACVGAAYAFGLTPDTIVNEIAKAASQAFRLTVPRHSLVSNGSVAHALESVYGDTRIEDLPLRLAVVAADLMQQMEVVLDEGVLWKAVLASMSIPGLYPPVWLSDRCLVDGGILDPLPVSVARQLGADVLIAVKLGTVTYRQPVRVPALVGHATGDTPGLLDVLHRSFDTMSTDVFRSSDAADVTVSVDVPHLHYKDFQQGVRFESAGETAFLDAWPEVVAVLPWLPITCPG